MPKIRHKIRNGIVLGLAFGSAMWIAAYGAATVRRYVLFGVVYGDWLNDSVTHLPQFVQAIALQIVKGG